MSERYKLIGDTIRRIDGFLPVASVYSRVETNEMCRRANCYDELLAAVNSLMCAYGARDGRNGNSGECWDMARAAIAKATGAPQ